METEKLYYQDPYQTTFTARVLTCEPSKGGCLVTLDRTAFYPEGGGQPADHGVLGGVTVTDVHEKDGVIFHTCDKVVEPGSTVEGSIDWTRRFDHMQQHSGEHILSGLLCSLYDCSNVGFHLGADTVTIDYDRELTWEQVLEAERQANEAIWRDTPAEITLPAPDALAQLDYRSKKELTGQVRIVEFPGVDICACCGTHVTHTGEIGMVKLLSVEKFREGVRIEMICGKRVLDYLNMVNDQNHQISVKLSAKMDKTAQAVERLQEENFRLKGQVGQLVDDMCRKEAERYAGSGSVLIFMDGMDADSVRKLADAVTQTCQGCCAVFSGNADGSYKYAMGEKDGDLRQFTKEMNAKLNGRGGGKPFFVQGSVQASEKEIRNFFEQ